MVQEPVYAAEGDCICGQKYRSADCERRQRGLYWAQRSWQVYHHQDAHRNPGTLRRKREGEWPVAIQAEEGICQAHWGGIWKQEPAVVGSSGGGFF